MTTCANHEIEIKKRGVGEKARRRQSGTRHAAQGKGACSPACGLRGRLRALLPPPASSHVIVI